MPMAAVIHKKLGPVLTDDALKFLASSQPELVDQLRERGQLLAVASSVMMIMDTPFDEDELAYLESIPRGMQEAVREIIVTAIEDEKSVHLQYSPAYDFELRVWDYGQAFSVHLAGPYPGDFPQDRSAS